MFSAATLAIALVASVSEAGAQSASARANVMPGRRVPNLQRFLERAGASKRVTNVPEDYAAGEIVTWMLPGNLPHIGIVSDKKMSDGRRPRIIHNIGAGPVEDDILFAYPITGHYRLLAAPRSTEWRLPRPSAELAAMWLGGQEPRLAVACRQGCF
jgi:hypothetical protein